MKEDELPTSFGEWLRRRRKALDLTQDELAQRAGCSIFALRKIESGERRPSKQLAGLLANALEIPQTDQPTFIRVARGDLNLERLHSSPPQTKPTSPASQPACHHLPSPPTPLLGRDHELEAMARIFNEPQCRLLTLTGMGGIGKTRLAIEFAFRQRERFPAGIHYIPLASVNSSDLIIPAIAEVLEFSFSGPVDLQDQLFNYLSHEITQPALLILDNLEHLLARSSAAAELVAEVLLRFPELKLICTSRERLNLRGEWIYELHGLPIPPFEYVDRVEDYSAVVLFIERARQMNAEFKLTQAEKPALARICHLVEGIPLAIELAAAWTGLLSCREIVAEIEKNIDFLTTSTHDIPERHRSLRATFDHSWRLLSDIEWEVLRRLSVFHGGFDRLAAEEVAGATLPLLSLLVSKSLVKRSEDGRYDLHEVIRQYALAYLSKDDTLLLITCNRHCDYYLKLASEYEKKLKSISQQTAVREMTVELDNMRAAWAWGITHQNFDALGRAVRSFGWYFEVAGLIHEGIDQLEMLVTKLTGTERSAQMDRTLGTTLVQQGLLWFRSGQFIRAQNLYSDAIAILRSVNARELLADALIFSGTIRHLSGVYLEAKQSIEEGLRYAQEMDDRWFSAYGIYNLGHIESILGEYQKGYDQMQEGLRLWRELGDPHSISLGYNFLVETQIALGRHAEAIASMHESIAICERTRNRWGLGTAYRYLGLALLAAGQYSQAQAYLQQSLETFGEYFKGWDIAQTLIYLGKSYALSGDQASAKSTLFEALRLSVTIHSHPLILAALTDLAFLNKNRDFERTASWLILVLTNPAATQSTKDQARHHLEDLEKQLGAQQIQAIRDKLSHSSFESNIESIYAQLQESI